VKKRTLLILYRQCESFLTFFTNISAVFGTYFAKILITNRISKLGPRILQKTVSLIRFW